MYGRRDVDNREPFLSLTLAEEDAIDFLMDEFGCLSRNKQSVFTGGKEYYRFETRCHPELRDYLSWYRPEKIWPEIEITPTILKYLYISDGTYDNTNSHNRIMISCSKESHNPDRISKILDESGYPVGRVYIYERDGRSDDMQLWFDTEQTEKMFEDMGEPVPGFEYKWPDQNS